MSVDKKILQQKTNQELELYLEPNTKFVSRSIEYAFDILKSRGRQFTTQDEQNFAQLLESKKREEEIFIHPNHIKAGYLVYLSGAIGLAIFIWKFDQLPHPAYNIFPFVILCLIFAMGYLIKRGTDWLKYVLLLFVFVGTMAIPMTVMNLVKDPILAVANIVQGLLQIAAVILMFLIPSCLRNRE